MINTASPLNEFLFLEDKIIKSIKKIIKSGNYILGENVKEFENNFSKFNNIKYCVGVSSGTDAIFLALKSLNIGKGDEIITVANTASATISAIIQSGAKPVLVDINEFYLIDVGEIEKHITKNTKAILPVHLYGQMCDMNIIMKIARKYKLKVIEDCSQSHGATFNNKKAGTFGDIGCFSFYPTKNLGSLGDAGAIITNNFSILKTLRKMREYGWKPKFNSTIFGWNSRLDEIQAGILNIKLKKLNYFNNMRIKIANYYNENIFNSAITLPNKKSKKNKHVYHLYVIRAKKRKQLINFLSRNEINCSIQYPYSINNQKYFSNKIKYSKLNNTEKFTKQIISLPIHPFLKNYDMKYIVNKINSYVS